MLTNSDSVRNDANFDVGYSIIITSMREMALLRRAWSFREMYLIVFFNF